MKRLNNNEANKLTRECIFTALMILMEKMDFRQITITDITNKAGVSRMAFYRNYRLKEDILTDYLDELFEMYIAEVYQDFPVDEYQIAYRFFSYFRQHNNLIINLIKADLTLLILKRFDVYLISIFEVIFKNLTQKSKYEIDFVSGGLYKVLIEWINGGLKESDDEMAEIICNFAKK